MGTLCAEIPVVGSAPEGLGLDKLYLQRPFSALLFPHDATGQAYPQIRRVRIWLGPEFRTDSTSLSLLYGIGMDLTDLTPERISMSW